MDISAGSVSASPNIAGRMDPGMKTNISTACMKGNMFVFRIGTFDFFTTTKFTLVSGPGDENNVLHRICI